MSVMQYDFRLFGPRKGQTVVINGHSFVNGHLKLVQSAMNMSSCMRVLSFYGAYARGTPGYDKALAEEEAQNGGDQVHQEAEQGAHVPVRSGVRPAGDGSTPQGSVRGSGDDSSSGASASGSDSNGNGHGDSGVPKFPEAKDYRPTEPETASNGAIQTAILKLDVSVNDHWVRTGPHAGKPKLSAVEEAYGQTGLTRDDLEAAMPGWTRVAAKEMGEMKG